MNGKDVSGVEPKRFVLNKGIAPEEKPKLPAGLWHDAGMYVCGLNGVPSLEDKERRRFREAAGENKSLARMLDDFFREHGVSYGEAVKAMRLLERFYLLVRDELADRELKVRVLPDEVWEKPKDVWGEEEKDGTV